MIGIIGGNGVAATNKLCELVEELYTLDGAFRDAHHPEILVWQATQAPSRSMYFEGRGESFIDDYVRIGCAMKNCGVDTICMCCNTAHIVVEELENRINVPFINLIEEVAIRVCNTPNIKKVGIMCSDGLRKFETYDEFIRKFTQTIEIVYPDSEHQALVTKGICNAKNTYRYTESSNQDNPYSLFNKVVGHLKENGCDCIIAGCTDIRNVFKYTSSEIQYIDSLEVLAECIFKISRK